MLRSLLLLPLLLLALQHFGHKCSQQTANGISNNLTIKHIMCIGTLHFACDSQRAREMKREEERWQQPQAFSCMEITLASTVGCVCCLRVLLGEPSCCKCRPFVVCPLVRASFPPSVPIVCLTLRRLLALNPSPFSVLTLCSQ